MRTCCCWWMPTQSTNRIRWSGKWFALWIHFPTWNKCFSLWSYCTAQRLMCFHYLQPFRMKWRKFNQIPSCEKTTVSRSGAHASYIATFTVHVSSFTAHREDKDCYTVLLQLTCQDVMKWLIPFQKHRHAVDNMSRKWDQSLTIFLIVNLKPNHACFCQLICNWIAEKNLKNKCL